MSELINTRDSRATIRWKLLTGASALALTAYVSSASLANAADSDRPVLWIELGGQLDQLSNSQQTFKPPFVSSFTQPSLVPALNVQKPPAWALDTDGSIAFQPEDSDWVFSASIRYGRSQMARHKHRQIRNADIPVNIKLPPQYVSAYPSYYHFKYGSYYPSSHAKFADGKARQSDRHIIVDFQVGKDVGLGMFGPHSTSVVSAGVRIAQFTSKSSVTLNGIPDLQYPTAPIIGTVFAAQPAKYAFRDAQINFHAYTGIASIERSFRGVGPSLAWTGSAPFAGDTGSGELSFDWGVNGSVLFGRQAVAGHHKTTIQTYDNTKWEEGAGYCAIFKQTNPCVEQGHFINVANPVANQYGVGGPVARHIDDTPIDRSRSVAVPNVGGTIGLSYRIEDFKVSMGYRADFFFDAMDGGIDTRKEENRGFFGPYASISIGIGD